MKYIVTGGCGFIGGHIVDLLINKGHEVIIIDNNIDNINSYINNEATYFNFDISSNNDKEKISKLFLNCDGVFHCAALVNVQESIDNPLLYEKNNTIGTLNILEACRLSNVKKLIFSSSAAVYGENEKSPLNEYDKTNPISPYGLQKLYGEKLCKYYSEIYKLNTVCLRYFNVYGNRQKFSSSYAAVVRIFLHKYLKKQPITITGDGNQTRDFINVIDIAEANLKSMESKDANDGIIINIGSGSNLSINELANFFKCDVEYINAVKEVRESLADINLAKKILNWEPTINIKNWINEKLIH